MAGGVLLLTWLVPGLQFIVLPLQYLNTHLHEMGHALATLITGGDVSYINVRADGSGVTWASIDHPIVVGSAGYVGASLIGAVLIAVSRTGESARKALLGISAILAIECIFWLRGDLVGVLSGFGYLILFMVLGFTVRGLSAVLVAQFVGMQQCLTSFQSVFALVNPRMLAFTDNDASILADKTHFPAILWAICWSLFSLILMGGALISAWSERKTKDHA